jgi:hypothetical protein
MPHLGCYTQGKPAKQIPTQMVLDRCNPSWVSRKTPCYWFRTQLLSYSEAWVLKWLCSWCCV